MNMQITREQAIKSILGVNHLLEIASDFINSEGLEPTQDSIAARELSASIRPESILTAYSQGISLIEVAADHIFAFTKTLAEPISTAAPWTITRAVLEASALSAWLLDTKIDAYKRIGRSLAFRYDGFVQQIKLGRVTNDTIDIALINSRIEEVETMAEGIGFGKLKGKNGERTGIGQVMPGITEIIRDTLQEEANYRLLSAMAHAHPWAYSQLSFKKVGETDFQANKAHILKKNIAPEMIVWMCTRVTKYFAHPLRFECELYGRNLVELDTILRESSREIGITN